MRSGEEISVELAQMIASVYLRPAMYAGATDAPESPRILCGVLWTAHWAWALSHERESELMRTHQDVARESGCVCLDFVATYRERHPNASFREQTQFVLEQWKVISRRMGVPLVDRGGHVVP